MRYIHDTFFVKSGGFTQKMTQQKRQKRITKHIKRKVAQNIFDALRYASEQGVPLDHFVTIRLSSSPADIAADELACIRAKLRSLYEYLARRQAQNASKLAYIYVIENPQGADVHAHILLHIPPELADTFHRKLERIVRRVRGVCGPCDILIKPVTPGTFQHAVRYLLKGVDAESADHFHLEKTADQGEVHGQRAGTSRNIGLAARDDAGWVPPRATKNAYKRRRYTNWMLKRIEKRRAQQRKNAEARRRAQWLKLREFQTSMSA